MIAGKNQLTTKPAPAMTAIYHPKKMNMQKKLR